jgi:hypothetical protein
MDDKFDLEFLNRHELSSGRISLSLYRLISHVLSSNQIRKLSTKKELNELSGITLDHEESEIVHLLIETAIHARITEERFLSDFAEFKPSVPVDPVEVGKLWQPESKSKPAKLNLRDACNKIVHARKITFNPSGKKQGDDRVSTKIYLFGQQQKQLWRACVDIPKFVTEAYTLAKLTWIRS